MNLGLADAAAMVVGGSHGMGLATARCLADDGARVAVVGRTRGAVDAAAAELTGRGSPDAVGLVADIGDAAAVDALFTDLGARWSGELNLLGPVAAFLASRRNSYMTGANVNVDGGSDFT